MINFGANKRHHMYSVLNITNDLRNEFVNGPGPEY